MSDLFEQLAHGEVPPPPAEFDRQLHERVNRSLTAMHLADLALGAVPWALSHMLQALGGLACLTVTGKFAPTKKQR